jgi:hypothetical protein
LQKEFFAVASQLFLILKAFCAETCGVRATVRGPSREYFPDFPGMFLDSPKAATGAVWQTWDPSTQFAPTVDPAPLPPGDYHICVTITLMPDGKIIWSLNRLDAATGRSWVAVGGGARRWFGMRFSYPSDGFVRLLALPPS